MCSKVPGFFLSSYRQTATNSPVFVSMNTFADLTDVVDATMTITRANADPSQRSVEYRNVSRVVPKENLWVRMSEDATTQQVQEMVDRLTTAMADNRMQSVNVRLLVEGTSTASGAMLIFFYVVAVINSVLAFFLLSRT